MEGWNCQKILFNLLSINFMIQKNEKIQIFVAYLSDVTGMALRAKYRTVEGPGKERFLSGYRTPGGMA